MAAQEKPKNRPDAGRHRNEELATRLYKTEKSHLLAVARRNTDAAEDAEDALQDSFEIFIDHYRPEAGSDPVAWLTLTLKRRCWAIGMAARRQRHLNQKQTAHHTTGSDSGRHREPSDPGASPPEQGEIREEARQIGNRFRALKTDQQKALALLALGYSYREIGEQEGWTYTKVNRSISEGRAALREQDRDEAA